MRSLEKSINRFVSIGSFVLFLRLLAGVGYVSDGWSRKRRDCRSQPYNSSANPDTRKMGGGGNIVKNKRSTSLFPRTHKKKTEHKR